MTIAWTEQETSKGSWQWSDQSVQAELTAKIFGKSDNHVPPAGRDLIRKTLHDKGVIFSFYEVAWAQRKYLDEVKKLIRKMHLYGTS